MSAREFLPCIEETARAAGEIHMRYFRRLERYEKKSAIDLITVADREADDLIASRIRARFPSHALLLEESGASGTHPRESEFMWVVDPLDGTTNYAHGLRMFAVSIAVLRAGVVIAGGIFAPALEEYYYCAMGEGAWRGSERLHVSATATLADSLLVTGFPYDRRLVLDPLLSMARIALEKSQGILRLGAAALDFAAIAAGHLDGFYEYNLKPWDVAAGSLLVTEAAGRLTDFSGAPYNVLAPTTTVATNGAIHDELVNEVTRAEMNSFPCRT